jgi:ornithine cyclodeaminase/alanine dehydrogenase
VTPDAAREAVLKVFADYAAGLNKSLPKGSIEIGPGHGFQAMAAASEPAGIATLKWVAMAPVAPGSTLPGINGLICVSDYATGAPLAVLDGDFITLIRTAAMSAAAATRLAPADPRIIGFIGCGLQAHAHLDAFTALFPGLTTVLAMSRSRSSAVTLAEAATRKGLASEVVNDADLLGRSDIVISMVPGAPGFTSFLDARKLPASSFVSAVDLGRSWLPDSLPSFDRLVSDSLAQFGAPHGVDGKPVQTVAFQDDLIHLSTVPAGAPARQRAMFCFRGFALADLALADLVLRKAGAAGIGIRLAR